VRIFVINNVQPLDFAAVDPSCRSSFLFLRSCGMAVLWRLSAVSASSVSSPPPQWHAVQRLQVMVREQNFRTRGTSGDGLQGRSLLVAPKAVSPVKALGYTPLHRKQVLWDTVPTCHQCVSTPQHINTFFNASLTAHVPWSRDVPRQRARPVTTTSQV